MTGIVVAAEDAPAASVAVTVKSFAALAVRGTLMLKAVSPLVSCSELTTEAVAEDLDETAAWSSSRDRESGGTHTHGGGGGRNDWCGGSTVDRPGEYGRAAKGSVRGSDRHGVRTTGHIVANRAVDQAGGGVDRQASRQSRGHIGECIAVGIGGCHGDCR